MMHECVLRPLAQHTQAGTTDTKEAHEHAAPPSRAHLHKLALVVQRRLVVHGMPFQHALAPAASQAALGHIPIHTWPILLASCPAARVHRAVRVPAHVRARM